jgi:hypothetical protein
MGAKKPSTAGVAFRAMRFLLRPQNRGLVLSLMVIALALSGSLYAWRRWGAPSLEEKDYAVTPERIAVTPQPAWIHANVKSEVLRSSGGSPMHLHDRRLVEHLAQAFALHPWVAQVVRVEKKYPAQVNVQLEYRKPVLVVKVDAPGDQGLLFLDQEAVLLPSADFAPTQARNYLRILAAGEAPVGPYGSAWGSPRMAGAAKVAAAWNGRWQALGLYWLASARPASGELLYELRTQDDRVRVIWGPAPGGESPGDPSPEEKITALERYVQDKGPLTRPDAAPLVDLRDLARGGP